ncbi:MAG TPA: flagellar basal body P-ring formation chaperone FlgA [Candidatus Competibacteraceae bacterium]|nr:flagellar basal body P-ring formation chaperone FlgA [Candidatus Competibacteraceae bacterium]
MQPHIFRSFLLGCCCGLAVPAFVRADPALQSLDDIQRTAHAFLTVQHRDRKELPKIRLQSLDRRLRLPKCQAALEAFLPSGARTTGNTSVGVRCPDAKPWSIYLSANVRIYDQVLIARRFLRRGTILSAVDIQLERRELSTLPGGYETDPQQLIGRQLQHALMIGKVISPRSVKMTPAVRRGETVTLIAGQSGIEITSSGIALSDASIGERLRVRNESSQRVIEGKVTANRRVEIGR